MAAEPPKQGPELFDAFLKPLVDKTEEMWAEMFSRALGSEQFAQAMGQMLRSQLLFQKAFQEQLERYFDALNLPTRGDLTGIARDLGELKALVQRLETRLDAAGGSPRQGRPRKRARSAEGTGESAGA